MSTLTKDELNEILAGTEGVTPGPWKREGASVQSVATGYIMETSGNGTYVGNLSSPRGGDQRDVDAAHIARLSPERVRSALSELLAARKKLAELEAALNQIIGIYERNIGRQTEKLGDIPLIARRALPSIPKGD